MDNRLYSTVQSCTISLQSVMLGGALLSVGPMGSQSSKEILKRVIDKVLTKLKL